MSWTTVPGGFVIRVRLTPRSHRTRFTGIVNDEIRIGIAAPPVDGAANSELIKFVAKAFGVAQSQVQIVAGSRGRSKRIRVLGTNLHPAAVFAPD